MKHSSSIFEQAQKVIPGGVNSPVRAFRGVGGSPIFIKQAKGAYMTSVDDKSYIDYIGSWGPMILGHAHPHVIEAVMQAVPHGLSFGTPTEIEVIVAQKIQQLMPNIEMLRMVNSGTEATMSAIRLARGYTKRDKFIKFTGCYHGHADALLVQAGSGSLTLGTPSSAGVPESFIEHTLVAEFNNIDHVKQLFQQYGEQIAAIIVEPVAGNMNCIPPVPGFLEGLRTLCDQYKSVLIFDEVMTGFRVAQGGAQALYNIKPDLTCLGKIIGGGMPVGAFGGRRDIMEALAPLGAVYQAGTLSGNPVAMAAGLATLECISDVSIYPKLLANTTKLMQGLEAAAEQAGVAFTTTHVCGMFGLYFSTEKNITLYQQVINSNVDQFKQFFHLMLEEGVYLAPSAFEAGFLSVMHTEREINLTIEAASRAFKKLSK